MSLPVHRSSCSHHQVRNPSPTSSSGEVGKINVKWHAGCTSCEGLHRGTEFVVLELELSSMTQPVLVVQGTEKRSTGMYNQTARGSREDCAVHKLVRASSGSALIRSRLDVAVVLDALEATVRSSQFGEGELFGIRLALETVLDAVFS